MNTGTDPAALGLPARCRPAGKPGAVGPLAGLAFLVRQTLLTDLALATAILGMRRMKMPMQKGQAT